MFDPKEFPAQDTQKVPGPVNTCVLKFPTVKVAFPPVAVINFAGAIFSVESCVVIQPCVESTKTKTTD